MCLDPRPDRLFRTRSARRLAARPSRPYVQPLSPQGISLPTPALLQAVERLAGDDDLVARGWVVLSRQA